MARRFEDQGGVATMDPSPARRWLASAVMRRVIAPSRLAARRCKAEARRRRRGAPHRVDYFHEIGDGYGHLAAQLLRPLIDAYDIELACHLVSPTSGANAPEPELLTRLSRDDAARIAPHYGLTFPSPAPEPAPERAALAHRVLAGVRDPGTFADLAPGVGEALWSDAGSAMDALAEHHGAADEAGASRCLAAGDALRKRLRHYSGAMFHYGGEWYWGVDRLYHLEERLTELGARRTPGPPLAPRIEVETGPRRDDGSLTLEIYPSVRSPYTAAGFDAAVALARDTGVNMVVRPVLPMVMRGVPATREKGVYIFTDASREARARGIADWGGFVDPIGEPVRRCYSLYPWAASRGRGVELLSSFLRAAFREGVNTNNDRGLRRVVEAAGLPWDEARAIVGNDGWEDEIEANRLAMYDCGLWGVPSFRLLGRNGETLLRCWGQDRIWLVAREIQRALARP